jgi:predicted DNA-binding transcriptional regulator YafY
MSKREYFLRQSLIIRKLRKAPCSFSEIEVFLDLESEIQEYDFRISKRTFHRDVNNIQSIFDIDIQYNAVNHTYFIAEDSEYHSEVKDRMLEAFDTFNMLNTSANVNQYIQFEKRMSNGSEHFAGLLHATKSRLTLNLTYHKFQETNASIKTVEPYLLKESVNRWYLVAKDKNDNTIKTYGLDRIVDFEFTQSKFNKPDYNKINHLFDNCFGIINFDNEPTERILLEFAENQGKYVRNFPLHNSQKIISDNNGSLIIELYLKLTEDLLMEILSHGNYVKVIEPKSLKESVLDVYRKGLAQ